MNWQNLIWSASRTGRSVGRVGRVRQVERVGQVIQVGRVGQVRQVGKLFGYRSLILRSLFAYCLLFLYCSLYIVFFVFLIFTSSKFFILLSDFNCISIC
ncbi:hypothetical protein [Capnocytophaga leadbetteri]